MGLALVVIARDESPRIARLLRSAAPHVDSMQVMDTGSTDDTVAIARACGAVVRRCTWGDDFAAARNAALDAANADWHLVLDADEWIVEGGPALRDWCRRPPDAVGAIRLDDHGAAAGTVHDWLSRLLPASVRYAGRVHEQPQHRLPVLRLPLVVGHDGYAPAQLAAKRGRNRRLLLAELQDAPEDAALWFQLGKDHAAYEEHRDTAAALMRADALLHADETDRTAVAWQADLSTRLIHALKKERRHAEALAHAEHRIGVCGTSPDFHFALGDLLLDWAAESPADAAALLPMAEAAWQRCLAIGERPDLPGSVQGRGSHLAAHNLAVIRGGFSVSGNSADHAACPNVQSVS